LLLWMVVWTSRATLEKRSRGGVIPRCGQESRSRGSLVEQALWQDCMCRLRGRLTAPEIGCWLQAIHPIEVRGRRLHAEVPSRMHLEQIRARLSDAISAVLGEILGDGAELVLTVNRERAERAPQAPPSVPHAAVPLSPYRFETFLVGDSNALAHAAAREVVARPGAAHNPLFLYGGVGLGKTHLATAVADAIGRGSRRRVAALSAEAFANDLIRALLTGGIDGFRARLRQIDVLIVDDIQFLAGKERMQEEFFHTFNALHSMGKQIVLASDQAPRSISGLEQRLQSRFEAGLTAEITAPDCSLRFAILGHKAKAIGFELPIEVAQWVAGKIVTSVRELEGALHRLVAACRWSERALDLGFAKEVLRPILRSAPPRTLEQVQRIVAESFHVTPGELVRHGRVSRLRVPRQVAMYLARKAMGATYAEIAAGFGGRDHSTVMHAVKRVEERRGEDPEFATLVDRLSEKLASA